MFRSKLHLTLLSGVLALSACKSETTGVGDTGVGPGTDAGPGVDVGPTPDSGVTANQVPQSEKARVNFKRQQRLAADFSTALELPRDQVCAELGRFDCFDVVHTVTLGGVSPYGLGIYAPLENTTKTTPIAVERVALSGCKARVDLDLADSANGVIFKDLEIGADGTTDISQDAAKNAVDRLYKRFLLRPATESEIEGVRGLYADAVELGEANPTRAWAIVSCFTVATTLESLFY